MKYDNPQNMLRASNTKFCLIINTTKIGSQYVRKFNHYENKEGVPDTELNVELVIKKDNSIKWHIDNGGDKISKEHLSDYNALDSFLNGTITKDVIILIREPFERFISAFNQDFIKYIFNPNTDCLHFLGLSILKNKENKSLYEWWSNNQVYLKQKITNLE